MSEIGGQRTDVRSQPERSEPECNGDGPGNTGCRGKQMSDIRLRRDKYLGVESHYMVIQIAYGKT
jgi:hypothetical protein